MRTRPAATLQEIERLTTPYNEKEFLNDKLSVVDVKAKDEAGRLYQIEIQLAVYHYLPARMLYTWADIYSQQLQSGQKYHELQPTYSIWLVAENLVKGDSRYAREYQFRDETGLSLIEHGGIWLLELEKFQTEQIETERQRWLKFFKDGGQLNDAALPEWMNTTEMRQAMGTLSLFSEKERNYHEYQARMNYLREQGTIQWEREQAEKALLQERLAKEAALRREETAQREKEAALQEIERLKALLGKVPE